MVDIIYFFTTHDINVSITYRIHPTRSRVCHAYRQTTYFSLQLFVTLIFLYAISIFLLNRIVIKFRNKTQRRRKKHSTASHVSPSLLSCSSCFLLTLQQNRTQSRLLYFLKVITRQVYLNVNSRKWRPSVKSFSFLITLLCVLRLLLRGQMDRPHLRQRKF